MAKNDTDKMTKNAMAEAILAMPYGELVEVANAMADIRAHRLTTKEEFAKFLFEWADAQ